MAIRDIERRIYSSATDIKLTKLRMSEPIAGGSVHAYQRARLLDEAGMPHIADVVRLLNCIGQEFLWASEMCDLGASRTLAAEVQNVINMLQEVILE